MQTYPGSALAESSREDDIRYTAQPINLMWTGGWDSTFRLCELLLTTDRLIQPYYVISTGRASLLHEIRATRKIKNALAARDKNFGPRILPTIFTEELDIPASAQITAARYRLSSRYKIGGQYDWLSRMVAAHGIEKMELCVHRDDRAHQAIEDWLAAKQRRSALEKGDEASDQSIVFGRFEFPIFNLTKLEMKRSATEWKIDDIMKLTWFCHTPQNDGKACGRCNPCVFTIEEGMAERVPLIGRIRYHWRRYRYPRK